MYLWTSHYRTFSLSSRNPNRDLLLKARETKIWTVGSNFCCDAASWGVPASDSVRQPCRGQSAMSDTNRDTSLRDERFLRLSYIRGEQLQGHEKDFPTLLNAVCYTWWHCFLALVSYLRKEYEWRRGAYPSANKKREDEASILTSMQLSHLHASTPLNRAGRWRCVVSRNNTAKACVAQKVTATSPKCRSTNAIVLSSMRE